jgi:predicted NAD/FAD-binding protein
MTGNLGDTLDIAVIGSGISGMAAAWLLAARHRVSLFEAGDRLGGHTNTVEIASGNESRAVDTGFIVYNEATYPNLVALFAHLGVATRASDMSFSVSLDGGRLEYAGSDLNGFFAQRRNLLNPRFLLMLRDLLRFYREAPRAIVSRQDLTLGAFLDAGRYGRAFRDDHLLPMAAAIWSAPAKILLDFPAVSFVRFCENHGLLRVTNRPMWRTVVGGSKSYIGPLTGPYAGSIHRARPIVGVTREPGGVTLRDASGALRRFDHVVIATHADTALGLLEQPRAAERALLGAFRYSQNRAVLHGDARLMPRRKGAWAAWNYLGRRGETAATLRVTYWMNLLQGLPAAPALFVTLNPETEPAGVLREDFYSHPVFDLGALAAQKRLWSLQGQGNVWYCGAHFGAGFHEDGLQAGLAVAEYLGGVRRPWTVAGESNRIFIDDIAPEAVPA